MKAVCSQESLSFALNIVSRAIGSHLTLPVLNNILIKGENGKLFFSATNLEIAITYFIDSELKNEGKITIPAKLTASYANLLEKGDVEIVMEDGFNLSITSKHSKTKIKGISADEFPLIPKVVKDKFFTIDKDVLQKAINQVVFSASMNISRPALTGVLFKVIKDKLIIVATDSFRLSEKTIHLDKKMDTDFSCIVPSKTVNELGKILSEITSETKVEINISKEQIQFKIGNLELISRLIEGSFPDYEKVIPQNKETDLEINVKNFITAVRKVSLFVAEINNHIKLSVTNDGVLLLSTEETQVGEVKADISVKIEGKNNQIALNALYILDFLNNTSEEIVRLILDNKLAPAILKPINSTDYLHIIMPLKL